MIKVSIQEAKTHFSRYIHRVEAGEVVVVCRYGRPVAELRAVASVESRPRVAGLLRGLVEWEPGAFGPMAGEELAEFDAMPARGIGPALCILKA